MPSLSLLHLCRNEADEGVCLWWLVLRVSWEEGACPPQAPWTTITVTTLLLYADPVPSNSCLSGISSSKRLICIFACLTFNMGQGVAESNPVHSRDFLNDLLKSMIGKEERVL